VVQNLPEQLIEQAEFLLRARVASEADVRRSVSTAYYALFHLLIRDSIANWKHIDHHSKLARAFDHKRMKDASIALLKDIGSFSDSHVAGREEGLRFKISMVAQTFVELQQARHKADYDIGESFNPLDASVEVAQARVAFLNWADVRDESIAQRYLYSLLFKDRP
jgi:uncharacterized protein (UPF0332 family)